VFVLNDFVRCVFICVKWFCDLCAFVLNVFVICVCLCLMFL